MSAEALDKIVAPAEAAGATEIRAHHAQRELDSASPSANRAKLRGHAKLAKDEALRARRMLEIARARL
jgi:hypothetical protein